MILRSLFFGVVHLLAALALFLPIHLPQVLVAVTLYLWMGFGITIGYHRLLTHRAFKCPLWLEYLLVTGASLAVQHGPLFWVTNHRIHHARSDQEGDVHSPRDGFWWSHMGWVLVPNSDDETTWRKYAPDLASFRYYHVLGKMVIVPFLLATVVAALLFGWESVPLVVCLPMVLCNQVTYSINSVCHVTGSRRFSTRDSSRNVWWLSIASLGESWHNNHHALPRSARQGLAWYEIDLSWMMIVLWEKSGLATHLCRPEQYPLYRQVMGLGTPSLPRVDLADDDKSRVSELITPSALSPSAPIVLPAQPNPKPC